MSELVKDLRTPVPNAEELAHRHWAFAAAVRAADRIEALEAALREAREVIIALVDSRWSEVESTGAKEVAFIDALLPPKPTP